MFDLQGNSTTFSPNPVFLKQCVTLGVDISVIRAIPPGLSSANQIIALLASCSFQLTFVYFPILLAFIYMHWIYLHFDLSASLL